MLKLEVKNDRISIALAQVSAALDDDTKLMTNIGEELAASTKRRFLAGEAPDGTKWAPKSEHTLRSYGAKGDPRPLFGPSGRLSSEIKSEAERGRVEIGSALIYAAVMHGGAEAGAFGSTSGGQPIPFGDIPPRPFLGVSDQDEEDILAIGTEWLERAAKGDI